jgi:hypothetical protein
VKLPAWGGDFVSIDATNFEGTIGRPDFFETARSTLGGGSIVLDAYAVARVEYPASRAQ